MAEWYLRRAKSGDDPIGPMTGDEVRQMVVSGDIKPDDYLLSPAQTKNHWVPLSKFSKLMELTEQRAIAIQHSQDLAKQTSQEQDLRHHVEQLLVRGEQIEFICMQHSKMLLKRDAVISTNQRMILAKPKLLGRFEFMDCMWIDLFDAHIKEGVFGATFSVSSNAGIYRIEHLSKQDARKLYTVAQEREQAARWQRRSLEMEERAAGAMQVNINNGQPDIVSRQAEVQRVNDDDPVEKLAKLKRMLDSGLIEQSEYDATKARILESM